MIEKGGGEGREENAENTVVVCAPSDAAADVIAQRLISILPQNPGRLMRLSHFQRKMDSVPVSLLSYSPNKDGIMVIPDAEELATTRIVVVTTFIAGCLPKGWISRVTHCEY